MANNLYVYRARTRTNQFVTGRMQAASIEEARKILEQNELAPVSVAVPLDIMDYIPFVGKVSLRDKTIFARQLATMIEAGLTLAQSLRLQVRQTKKGKFQDILNSILSDLQEGFGFSTALAKFPETFDSIFINIIRSGEATGKLELVLLELADNMEKEMAVRNKIRGALVYPIFILVVMMGVGVLMATKVIPQLSGVFLESGKTLPASTTFMLALSNSMVNQWYLYVGVVAALVVGVPIFLKSDAGQEFYSKVSLKVPIAGTIIEQSSMARFSRLMGMLLNAGVPMLDALRLINDSFTNRQHQRSLSRISSEVERGVPMSTTLISDPLFPDIVGQMAAVGEQTGKMDEVMTKVAEYYDTEVDTKVSSIATLIEPLVIVLLGIGVAFLVQAVLLPIYQASTSI